MSDFQSPFPESPRAVFTPNPIVMALAQVHFPTVLAISAEPPVKFQELVRHHFPIFRERQGITIQFGQPVLAPASQMGTRVFDFATADGNLTLSLAQDFLSVQTSRYETWDRFRPHIELGLRALIDVYSPAFMSRLGLRYQDLIVRSALGLSDVPWKDLLDPSIAGEIGSEVLSASIIERFSNATLTLNDKDERLTINHGLVANQENEQCYLIDADFYCTRNIDPNSSLLGLDSLKKHSGRFFRWAISPRLADSMAPKPLE